MKRFITILSVALMAGCTLALADSSSPNTDALNAGQTNSQADQTTTTTTKKTAKADKSCTDDNGNVLKKGDPGFRACWHEMHAKQESGISGAKKDENNQNKMESNGSDETSESHTTTQGNQ